MAISDDDLAGLGRCVELAREALDEGDEPFGSVLVDATVYTSGEHCPMCAAGQAWVGLGRIVYATSSAQLTRWLTEWGAPTPPVAPLPITAVAPGVVVDGPAVKFNDAMKALYAAKFRP